MKTNSIRSLIVCALLLAAVAGCQKKQDVAADQNASSPDQGTGAAPGAPRVNPSISPTADPSSPLYGWEKYNSDEGKFTAMLPNLPKEDSKSVQAKDGEVQVHAFASEKDEHDVYAVTYYDVPKVYDAKLLLAKVEQVIISGQDAKIISSQPIQFQNYPGTEFEFVAGGKANYSGHCRLILVGQRVYALTVLFLTAVPNPAERNAFYDSFSLHEN